MENIDLKSYKTFVEAVTSETSKNHNKMIERIEYLVETYSDINVPLLITSSDGLSAEAGEIKEIAKKVLWQGKELSSDVVIHIKKELGDVIFYWFQACIALKLDPMDIIQTNHNKLESRYPGGIFSVKNSENRKHGDI